MLVWGRRWAALGRTHAHVARTWLRTVASAATPPRVRFAPSPTGFLHVGGLRTALFNQLFARRHGGQWVLRIEDTDQTRLVPGATEALQEALAWAGLHYDEGPGKGGAFGPYVQSERLPLYREYAERLIREGKAYRDFRPPEPPAVERSAARAAALLREAYLPPSEDEAQELIAQGRPYVVRLRMERVGAIEYGDLVYGHLKFRPDKPAGVSDDPILLKSDGWPTYHLANAVDDTEMRITHVLRGEEWLPSMPKHLALYAALGVPAPQFAHLPLLINADGTKLSKRTGDVHVESYRARGYEPEALINLVALTGYNHQHDAAPADPGAMDDKDVMTMAQLEATFELGNISHARATLPMVKLPFLNRRHLATKIAASHESPDVRTGVLGRLRQAVDTHFGDNARFSDALLLSAADLASQRAETLEAMPAEVSYLFTDPTWDAKECVKFRKSVPSATFRTVLNEASTWAEKADFSDTAALHDALQAWIGQMAEREPPLEGGRAAVQKTLRIALTGRRAGPPVADIAALLGREQTIARLQAAREYDERQGST